MGSTLTVDDLYKAAKQFKDLEAEYYEKWELFFESKGMDIKRHKVVMPKYLSDRWYVPPILKDRIIFSSNISSEQMYFILEDDLLGTSYENFL